MANWSRKLRLSDDLRVGTIGDDLDHLAALGVANANDQSSLDRWDAADSIWRLADSVIGRDSDLAAAIWSDVSFDHIGSGDGIGSVSMSATDPFRDGVNDRLCLAQCEIALRLVFGLDVVLGWTS